MNTFEGVSFYELLDNVLPDPLFGRKGNVERLVKLGYASAHINRLDVIIMTGAFEYCCELCVDFFDGYLPNRVPMATKTIEEVRRVIDIIMKNIKN